MKLALFQMDCAWENPAENLRSAESWFERGRADLVLLPEMFTTGFTMRPEQVAEPMDGPTVGWMRETAVRYDTAVAGSVAIREPDGRGGHYFNRLVFVFPDGSYRTYDKRHLFRMGGESGHYTGGGERLIVEYKEWKICPLVCYDLRFPVWSRNSGEAFDLLLYTANWPAPRRAVWQTLLRARAIENLCYVAGVNRVGIDPLTTYSGDSVVVDFKGDVVAEPLGADPQVVTAELDREALLSFRHKFPAHLDADAFTLTR